ncbi:NUDIX hydrolase [Psychrobacillus antarcticus]|uniref:NUDIX hydrolase n=1 Tax=Psychrobacillus antarcticus TaxID=2879115 RepID=UPI00240812ED|nr:NUDIX hydrolase [Psychrobacillus antarcticus]
MDSVYIYLQLRSDTKKDYPNLFDITAASHILFDESIQDGIREIKEEVGIEVSFIDLTPLGVINYCVMLEDFIDKELANVFLYKYNKSFDDFIFQKEEVAGIVKVKFADFEELWLGERDSVRIKGVKLSNDGSKVFLNEYVGRERFVPNHVSFYQTVIQKMKENL